MVHGSDVDQCFSEVLEILRLLRLLRPWVLIVVVSPSSTSVDCFCISDYNECWMLLYMSVT